MAELNLLIFGIPIRIRSQTFDALEPIEQVFAPFVQMELPSPPQFDYQAELVAGNEKRYSLDRGVDPICHAVDLGAYLYYFDKDFTIQAQLLLPRLYFLHSAALEFDDKIFLMTAASGSGKSTLTWALLHHGCRFLSDELSPINVDSNEVLLYPRALGLKQQAPTPYGLPDKQLSTSRGFYLPIDASTIYDGSTRNRLRAIFHVQYDPNHLTPSIQSMSKAMASTLLYTNTLNPLSHNNAGLQAAVSICKDVESFKLLSADLTQTCELLKSTINQL